MKFPGEKKQWSWAFVAFITVAACVLFYMVLQKWDVVWDVVCVVTDSLRPITYGLILAYLLNPLMNGIEKKMINPAMRRIFKKRNIQISGLSRVLSIVITWIVVALFVLSLAYLVVPEFISSAEKLIEKIPEYAEHLLVWIGDLLGKEPGVYEFLSKSVSGFATNVTEIFNNFIGAIPDVKFMLELYFLKFLQVCTEYWWQW